SDHKVVHKLREYVGEVQVTPDSKLVGRTLIESRLGADYDLTVITIVRNGDADVSLHRDTQLESGDLLIVKGAAENLMRAQQELALTTPAERHQELTGLAAEHTSIIEATLAPYSRMVGLSLRETRFRDRFGFTVLAIWRQGEIIAQRLHDIPLEFGDVLLLQGLPHRLQWLQQAEQFLVLEPVSLELRRRNKAPLAVGVMALVLVLAILAGMHISMAMVIGAVLMVLTRCLTMDEAYQSIDWRTVFLVAGMLPLGMAMETTGTARFLADLLMGGLGGLGPPALLAGTYLLVALITQPMSNAAAVVLIAPIAIDTALSLGADPRPFVMVTAIGAATSFLTPVGHKANVLIFGPGGYRFLDFTRVGWLLTIALLVVTMLVLPLFWPLFP
ncbi:MAG: anion permease, partial [Chloroflexi bacterium]|nr:anion permease [Chloroflexota bacterium]